MRSFVVAKTENSRGEAEPDTPGWKCSREYVTFRGLNDPENISPTGLVEKRVSMALTVLPHERPGGHFAFVSLCDDHGSHFGSRISAEMWKEYGLHSAGLYTGFAMFQLQICVAINCWVENWNHTLQYIDEKVTLKVR